MVSDTLLRPEEKTLLKLVPDRTADTVKAVNATRLIKADNPLTGKRKWESEE